ncbi:MULTISPECIES: hypothetical protein [unclassified Psychrobacter]|uniref:hypothetical protein n=1 Tax=unclassified Psychrobacter TaxID=196806 RepID=UPI0018F58556|nr:MULTISPECIES: hypothetical protein [unclassified Psychrobacter]
MEDNLFDGLDEATRKELEKLLQVTREKDGNKAYANAQIDIFRYILEPYEFGHDKLDNGIFYLRNVKEADGNNYYLAISFIALTQSILKKNYDENCLLFIRVLEEGKWSFDVFFNNAFKIAKECLENGDCRNSKKLFSLIGGSYSYQATCYERVCELTIKMETKRIGELSESLIRKVEEIIDILRLDFLPLSEDEQAPERKLAHYTGTYTTNKLLFKEENKDKASAFRLNTINNVNDPSEGKLLKNYLEDVKESSFYKPDFDEKLHAFISCFTFNHDSLNQFRLYGKEDNKEASGVSLVFNKEFFKETDSQSSMTNISIDRTIKNVNDDSDEEKGDSSTKRIEKQSVMRCVYIDPTSDYIHLAQRNRLTFFREFGRENLEGSSTAKAEAEWNEYKKYITEKTEEFKKAFKELKEIYRAAIASKKSLKNVSEEDINEIDSLLDMIILPLKYLIKHSAFQEEQECRMVYITSLKDERVQMDFGKFLYVEYEPEVKANLDKIYIAPAATQYQTYLAKLLCDTDVKIELSNNPFRLPTSH